MKQETLKVTHFLNILTKRTACGIREPNIKTTVLAGQVTCKRCINSIVIV